MLVGIVCSGNLLDFLVENLSSNLLNTGAIYF